MEEFDFVSDAKFIKPEIRTSDKIMDYYSERNFLQNSEQKELNMLLEKNIHEFKDALIYYPSKEKTIVDQTKRKSQRYIFNDDETYGFLDKVFVTNLNSKVKFMKFYLEKNEIDIIRYKKGDFFKKHKDLNRYNTQNIFSYTLIYCLMGTCQGGGTDVWIDDRRLTATTSKTTNGLVLFHNKLEHQGRLVRSGIKMIMKLNIIGIYVADLPKTIQLKYKKSIIPILKTTLAIDTMISGLVTAATAATATTAIATAVVTVDNAMVADIVINQTTVEIENIDPETISFDLNDFYKIFDILHKKQEPISYIDNHDMIDYFLFDEYFENIFSELEQYLEKQNIKEIYQNYLECKEKKYVICKNASQYHYLEHMTSTSLNVIPITIIILNNSDPTHIKYIQISIYNTKIYMKIEVVDAGENCNIDISENIDIYNLTEDCDDDSYNRWNDNCVTIEFDDYIGKEFFEEKNKSFSQEIFTQEKESKYISDDQTQKIKNLLPTIIKQIRYERENVIATGIEKYDDYNDYDDNYNDDEYDNGYCNGGNRSGSSGSSYYGGIFANQEFGTRAYLFMGFVYVD
jgi:hypothetical protein